MATREPEHIPIADIHSVHLEPFHLMCHMALYIEMCLFHDDSSHFFRIYQNKEVARCYHGYCSYAPLSDIVKHKNQYTIPSSSRICIQILFTYPALPNCHFQILPLYYQAKYVKKATSLVRFSQKCLYYHWKLWKPNKF